MRSDFLKQLSHSRGRNQTPSWSWSSVWVWYGNNGYCRTLYVRNGTESWIRYYRIVWSCCMSLTRLGLVPGIQALRPKQPANPHQDDSLSHDRNVFLFFFLSPNFLLFTFFTQVNNSVCRIFFLGILLWQMAFGMSFYGITCKTVLQSV